MAPSIVLELQHDALNRTIPISDLLRKALVISHKLKLGEFKEWIEKELNGYHETAEIPQYREFKGTVKGWNPVNGWIPVIFDNSEEAEIRSRRKTGQTIAKFEEQVKSADDTALAIPLAQSDQCDLGKSIGFQTQFVMFIDRSSVAALLDVVRTIVLNWTLKLEEQNILGEELSFTRDEQIAAQQTPQNINNFFGAVHNPQIQQSCQQSSQYLVNASVDADAIKPFVDMLRKQLDFLELPEDKKAEVEAEAATIEAQLKSPKPKVSILRESLDSLKRILEGAGGNIAAQLVTELAKLIVSG